MTKPSKCLYNGVAALALLCLAGVWQQAQAQEKAPAGRTLKVKLNYTGSGTVDEKHRIFLFIFDTPEFIKGDNAMPIAFGSGTAKDATVTVSDLATSPVYLIAIYDPTGAYDGMSKPPSGVSLGIYWKTPGEPGPIAIEAGKTTQIDLAFDDNVKMP